jgi:hypothetical protein
MRIRLLGLVLLASLLAWPASAQDTNFYTPPVASLPKVSEAPRLDGLVEPGEWAGAVSLSPFIRLGGNALPEQPTEVYMMYDDHNLYVAAVLHDPNPAQLKAEATARDGEVWADDSLELFFDTDDQRQSYIHLAVNAQGIQYDAYVKDQSADYRWNAKTAVLAHGWSVELELPFANDYPPAPGMSWGFAACRHRAASGEYSTWMRAQSSFHEIANFGSIIFDQTPLTMQITALGGLWLGPNTAQTKVQNQGPEARSGKINLRVMGRDKRGNSFGSTKFSLGAGGDESKNVSYTIQQDGFSTVAFALTDEEGKTVWRSAPYPVTTPEVAPQIAAIEAGLAAAVKEWMKLPAGETRQSLQPELDALSVQWRYLINQYRGRQNMSRDELENLTTYGDKLQQDVEQLGKRIQSAKLYGNASFAVTAVSSLQHVFPDQFTSELDRPAVLDGCRNETEALQLVMLPFRES